MSSSPVNYYDEKSFKVPNFNIKFVSIPKTQSQSFQRVFPGPTYQDGLVKSEPGGFVINTRFGDNAEKMFRIEPRKSEDVWLITNPKAGIYQIHIHLTV